MADQPQDMISLNHPDATRIDVAGGKAGRLAVLLAAGFPVPEGFVLTTAVFERFLTFHGLGQEVTAEQVMRSPLPDDLRLVLASKLKELGDGPLAVRSSGVAEDLAGASYAGQYETILGVEGLTAVEEAVRHCWASAFSERVRSYRHQRGEAGAAPMAVLVQRLIQADAAGVAFTANPVTGDPDDTIVSAVRGLGERLVSGEASPDEWIVRAGRAECRSQPENALQESQVREVAEMARRIEAHFGSPQDVEWAIAGGSIYALQARPITTLPEARPTPGEELSPRDWLTRGEVPAGFWAREDHFPLPITPMFASMVTGIASFGFRAAFDELSIPAPARQYVVVDGYAYGGSWPDAQRPTREGLAAFEEKVATQHWRSVLGRWPQIRRGAIEILRQIQGMDLGALSDDDLHGHIRDLDGHLRDWMAVHFTNNISAVPPLHAFATSCQERLGLQDTEALELLAGASEASSRSATLMEGLAAKVIAQPLLRAALDRADAASRSEIQELFRPYLEEYGWRSPEFEFCLPTAAEQPEQVVQLLREAVTRLEAGKGGAAEAARQRTETRIAQLKVQLPDDAARAGFEARVRETQQVYGVRDDDVGLTLWGLGLMRQALLEAGRRLTERGILADRGQVLFLLPRDLDEALSATPAPDLRERADIRHADFLRQQTTDPPHVFGAAPGPPPPLPLSDDARRVLAALAWFRNRMGAAAPQPAEGQELRGLGASSGAYRGLARVIRAVDELDRVGPGEVLICPTTNPSWTEVFARIGALVADGGGILSHPAILAREFGIPAVLGTWTATKTIPDGAVVEVDGSAGLVRWTDVEL
ncbi:MAG: phosphoenolpyruvate synthase/pyruvate phosphate dikinase [Chloroflexi bacterium]|nr:phosphoenolpyruvate synthase/pyruvate phosphate dikinase [Chloroflexota bacterium]